MSLPLPRNLRILDLLVHELTRTKNPNDIVEGKLLTEENVSTFDKNFFSFLRFHQFLCPACYELRAAELGESPQ